MNRIFLLIISFTLISSISLSGQINLNRVVKNVKKRAEVKIENKIEKGLNSAVDTIFNKTEKEAKKVIKGDEKKDPGTDKQQSETTIINQDTTIKKAPSVLVWSTYDFVPGSEIIFEDDFKGEINGEFPSRWDMVKGGFIENVVFDGENVVYFKKSNANVPDAICPLLDVRKEDYLPDEFTIELDCYFGPKQDEKAFYGYADYYLFLFDVKNQRSIMSASKPIRISYNSVAYNFNGDTYPGITSPKQFKGWRHVSISFNKRALKGYLDDKRLLNIPNCEFNPTGIMISYHNVTGSNNGFIKNVKIAKGAVPLYDKVLSEGKFVTHGIKFDVNKSTIKPESMGTINYVFKMMTDNPSLNFSVEGHTDSDGEDALNQKLSEARAKAVSDQLISMGVPGARLKSKGIGESKPLSANDTPEGKANNRRVEFVKF